MTDEDMEAAQVRKAVNTATRRLIAQIEDQKRKTDRMVAALISKHRTELADRDGKIERLELEKKIKSA